MKLSEAILLGDTLKKFDSGQWLSDDGSCGCALGGAMLAVGRGEEFVRQSHEHSMGSSMAAFHVPSFRQEWPWIQPCHVAHISMLAHEVQAGMPLDKLLAYVRSIEPAELPDISLEEQHRLEDIDAERESLDERVVLP